MNKAFVWLISLYLLSANGCSTHHATEDSRARPGRTDGLLTEFDGGRIAESDLPREAVFEAEEALYQAKLRQIRKLVEEKFLEQSAKKRGLSVDEFKRREIAPRYSVTDWEVDQEFRKYMGTFTNNPAFKGLPEAEQERRALAWLQLKPDPNRDFQSLIQEGLRGRFSKRKEQEVVQRLVKEAGVRIYLAEPEPPVYNGSLDGYPVIGPATAPVTIVDFRDFKCPFCAQSAQALKKVVEAFPGKVRVVFKNASIARDAQKAAEAAFYAHEQGKFWEYHDILFANQKKLGMENLKQYAARLGLDMARFQQSLQSGKYEAKVKGDLVEALKYVGGTRYEGAGTHWIYVNGKLGRSTKDNYLSDYSRYVEEALQDGRPNGPVIREVPVGVLAEVDGVKITGADLPKGVFYDGEERLYQVKLEQVKKFLEPKVLELAAKKRGISVDSLYHREIFTTATPNEVKAQYEAFKGYVAGNPRLMRLGEEDRKKEILTLLKIDPNPSRTFDDLVMQKLVDAVRNRKLEQGKPALITRLMEEADVKIHLEPPRPPVYDIATQGYPSLGPENAPVTIVEFADFQCPYCAQSAPTLNQALARYPGKVRVVFHNFPLPSHSYAQKAHEAAECAREQGKFWEYHDLLFAHQNALDVKDLKQYASDMGLNVAQFNQCLDTGKYSDKVKQDFQEGLKYNVRGTPSFFINGTPQRVRTFEQFAWHITGGKEGKPVPSMGMAAIGGG